LLAFENLYKGKCYTNILEIKKNVSTK
jgi:hypothetical protein